jgi:hypothetical protein
MRGFENITEIPKHWKVDEGFKPLFPKRSKYGRNKYGNEKVLAYGRNWDSKAELARYEELRLLEKAGEIHNLNLQPRFIICPSVIIAGERKMPERYYIADFMYYQDCWIIEDKKSEATRKDKVYRLKRQLFLYQYGDKYKFIESYEWRKC